MEEKLGKLSQGQWYNDVLQQARESGKNSVDLAHFRRMIDERDEIPFDTLREILKFPLFDQLDRLSKDLAARDKDIADLTAKADGDKKMFEEEIKSLQSKNMELSTTLTTKDRTIADLGARASEVQEKCVKEKQVLENQINGLRAVAASKDKTIAELQAQGKSDGRDISEVETAWKNEIVQVKLASAAKDQTIKDLIARNSEDSKKCSEERDARQAEIDNLKHELSVSKLTVEEMKSEGKGGSKTRRIAEAKVENEALEAKLKNTSQAFGDALRKLKQSERTIEDLNGSLKDANNENDTLYKEIEDLDKSIEDLRQEIAKKDTYIKKCDSLAQEKDDKISQLTIRLEDCEKHRIGPNTGVVDKQRESQVLKERLKTIKDKNDEIERLKEEIIQKDKHNELLQQKLIEWETWEKHELPKQWKTKDDKIAELEDKLKDLEKDQDNALSTATDLENRSIEGLQEKLDVTEAWNADLQGQIREKDERITDLEKQLKACEEHRPQAHESKAQEQYDARPVTNEQAVSTSADVPVVKEPKDEEITVLKSRLQDCEAHGRKLEAEISMLKEENKVLAAQLHVASTPDTTVSADDGDKIAKMEGLEGELQQSETARGDLSERIAKLEDQISWSDADRENLSQEIIKLKDKNGEIGGEKVKAEREYETMRLAAQQTHDNLKQARKDLEEAMKKNRGFETEKKSWTLLHEKQIKEIKNFQDRLAEAASREAELHSKLETCEENCKRLQSAEVKSRGTLEDSLAKDDQDTKRLQDQVKKLEDSLKAVEESHKLVLSQHEMQRKKLEGRLRIAESFRKSTDVGGLPSVSPATDALQATVEDLRRKLRDCEEHREKLQSRDTASGSFIAESALSDSDPETKRLRDRVEELQAELEKKGEDYNKLDRELSECKEESKTLAKSLSSATEKKGLGRWLLGGGSLPSIASPAENPLQATVDDLRTKLSEYEKYRKQVHDAEGDKPEKKAAPDNGSEIKRLQDQVDELRSELAECNEQRRKFQSQSREKSPGISDTPDSLGSTSQKTQVPPRGVDSNSPKQVHGFTGLMESPEIKRAASFGGPSSLPATQVEVSTEPTPESASTELAAESDEIPLDPAEILAKLKRVMSINEHFRYHISQLERKMEHQRQAIEERYLGLIRQNAESQGRERLEIMRSHHIELEIELQARDAARSRERELLVQLERLEQDLRTTIGAMYKLERWYWAQMKNGSESWKAELAAIKAIINDGNPAHKALRQRAIQEGPDSDAARLVYLFDIHPDERDEHSYLSACEESGIPPENYVFSKEARRKMMKEEEMALERGVARQKALRAREAAESTEAGPRTSGSLTVTNLPANASSGSGRHQTDQVTGFDATQGAEQYGGDGAPSLAPPILPTFLSDAPKAQTRSNVLSAIHGNPEFAIVNKTSPPGAATSDPINPNVADSHEGRPLMHKGGSNGLFSRGGNGMRNPPSPRQTRKDSSRFRARMCLIVLLVSITLLVLTVWNAWVTGQLLQTGYGYYFHGGFSGYQQDVCFGRWQFGFVVLLVWLVSVVSFIMAKGMAISQDFVAELATAITAALIARRPPRRG